MTIALLQDIRHSISLQPMIRGLASYHNVLLLHPAYVASFKFNVAPCLNINAVFCLDEDEVHVPAGAVCCSTHPYRAAS